VCTRGPVNELRPLCGGRGKRRVLVFVGAYLPGFKAGGPIQSIANMVAALGDEYEFLIITRDRDLDAAAPYEGIRAEEWTPVGKARVLYVPPGLWSWWRVVQCIRAARQEVLYLNSFLARGFSMLPAILWRLGLLGRCCLILAPKGEFSAGALKLKSFRKRAYIGLAKALGVYDQVVWHASSSYEAEDIRRTMGASVATAVSRRLRAERGSRAQGPKIVTAVDLAGVPDGNGDAAARRKRSGELDLVFLSRIARMKNLDGALSMLRDLAGRVRLNIYGPAEDTVYWGECQALVESLPGNVSVREHGCVPHQEVGRVLAQHDVLFLPTRGEAFGHVITEALLAGRPVLISDQTPWRDLESRGAGWDIPLDRPDRFRCALQECIDMDADRYAQLCTGAARFAREQLNSERVLQDNRALLNSSGLDQSR
jgi:glycosyltransferase involved in cell wall biosynthesis